MHGVDVSVLLACGYALFLAAVAAILELVARHSHHRSERLRTVGFAYYPELDVWKCPNGKHLYRADVSRDSTAVIYRAAAHHCNSCPIKARCTDSDEGRTLEVQPNSWLQSELRRFHRGLSLMLLLLADLVLVVAIIEQNTIADQVVAGILVLCISTPGIRLASCFFRRNNQPG